MKLEELEPEEELALEDEDEELFPQAARDASAANEAQLPARPRNWRRFMVDMVSPFICGSSLPTRAEYFSTVKYLQPIGQDQFTYMKCDTGPKGARRQTAAAPALCPDCRMLLHHGPARLTIREELMAEMKAELSDDEVAAIYRCAEHDS